MTKSEAVITLRSRTAAPTRQTDRTPGFSLLELLIVVAIILIIATIAIPSLLRSRQSANESGAVSALRMVNTAQITYMTANGGIFGNFSDLVSGSLLDPRFAAATPTVGGYTFTINLFSGNRDYSVEADPAATATGRYDYYSAGLDAVVRYKTNLGGKTPGAPVE